MPPAEVPAALVAAHVLSRWSTLPLLRGLPYARTGGGVAAALTGGVAGSRLAAGTVGALLIVFLVLGKGACAPVAGAAAATAAAGLFFRARLGGYTGDCLGAANQLVELCVLLALAAHWPAPA
jgi:adenosylcobinamide-GDP ribazoletransferase